MSTCLFMPRLTRRHFLQLGAATLAGGVLTACATSPRQVDYTVTIRRDVAFEPASLTVPLGAIVAWHHMAESVHTVTADPDKAQMPERMQLPEGAPPFDSGDLFSGQRWVHTFDVVGTYIYFCRYHELDEMIGVITVTA